MRNRTVTLSVLLVMIMVCAVGMAQSSHPDSRQQRLLPVFQQTPPIGIDSRWINGIQKNLYEKSFELSWSDTSPFGDDTGAWQALNPAQGFRTAFSENGIRIVPTGEKQDAWIWGLELMSWGREGSMKDVPPGNLQPGTSRMDLDRGNLQEWFINDERGLEQGFTIPVQPAGKGYPLNLDLQLVTDLHPVFSDDGQAVDFFKGRVHALRYAELKVFDAIGVEVTARFVPISGGIRIEIDETQAVYPLTVDPFISSLVWEASGDSGSGQFGQSIAAAGDVNGDGYSDAIVGDPYNNAGGILRGRAHLYLGSPAGLSMSAATVIDGDDDGAQLGWSVSAAGDVNGDGYSDVVIGAPFHNADGDRRGRAYLHLGSATGLSTNPASTITGDEDMAEQGWSVATAGDVNGDGYSDIIIGAPEHDAGGVHKGRAYLYLGSPSGLATAPYWTVSGEYDQDYFGSSVATAGDVNGDGYSDFIISAPYQNSFTGRAYVYHGSPSGPSTVADWSVPGDTFGGSFGTSVCTAGDVNGDGFSDVIVGAPEHDADGDPLSFRGRVYLFTGSNAGLQTISAWTGNGGSDNAYFGWSVATGGDVNGDGFADVLIGAFRWNGVGVELGAIYLYLGSESGFPTSQPWVINGETDYDHMGYSTACAGDVNGDGFSDILVSAPGAGGTGQAYGFLGAPEGLDSTPYWTKTGGENNAWFGSSVASAGDVNGDGYADVLVGAYGHDAGAGADADRGEAFLYLGKAGGLNIAADWIGFGTQDGAQYGYAVASAGDVNGDGYSDFLVGAHGHDAGWGADADMGQVYLYMGSTSSISLTPAWTGSGDEEGAHFGFSTASAGDVNGDGYTDVIVGAYLHDAGGAVDTDRGRAYLYLGSSLGLETSPTWTSSGDTDGAWFGFSVAPAGDVNGDGYSDVLIGAPHHPGGGTERGRVYLYLGSPSGLGSTAAWTASGDEDQCDFGVQVATAGDVNGDGYADLLIGADLHDAGGGTGADRGMVFHYLGSPEEPVFFASWSWVMPTNDYYYGRSLSSAGDVNGDGYSDVVVGAPNNPVLSLVDLFLGSASGLTWEKTLLGSETDDQFGGSVASAGDVNGDGYVDVIIGASHNDGLGTDRGEAYVYLGNGGAAGFPALPRQLKADQTGLISPLGLAYNEQCRLGMKLRSPFGRTLVSLEWQAVPLGVTFNPLYSPIERSSSWWNSGITGTNRTTVVDLVSPDAWGPWTWRVRTRYATATSPFQSHGPWFTPAANGLTEMDLRTTTAEAPPPPPVCVLPDEPCWLYLVDKVGTDYTLNWQDPNQSDQRTGWNIRRSNDAGIPKDTWPLVGTNIVDMDAGTANYQWTDHSGDDPAPSPIWYYQVTTYNASCPAEGPF